MFSSVRQQVKTEVKQETASPTKGRKKKQEEEEEVWKWYVLEFGLICGGFCLRRLPTGLFSFSAHHPVRRVALRLLKLN